MGETINYPEMALYGMKLILSNDWKAAEDLFSKHRERHILMASGNSFFHVLQAVMTFEDDKINEASKSLKETILRCKSLQQKIKMQKNMNHLETSLECDIAATDCLLYEAGLAAVNQDISGYLRAGWCLRRAWKNYKKLHKELALLTGVDDNLGSDIDPPWFVNVGGSDSNNEYKSSTDDIIPEGLEFYNDISTEGNCQASDIHLSSSPSMPILKNSIMGESTIHGSASNISLPNTNHANALSPSAASRLFGSVCFGYGAFHLMISLCPPRILRLVKMFGFRGDRIAGLHRLEHASNSTAMMAPLATLMLVHYHSVIRPFFSLDGPFLPAGIDEAKRFLTKADIDYPNSALFNYFRGRVEILEGETEKAMMTIEKALHESANQRDTQHICLYEIGRLSMMRLDWKQAALSFLRLRHESRWAKCFYAYLAAISMGANSDITKSKQLMKEVPELIKYKNNQLEIFVRRRAVMFAEDSLFHLDIATCKLLIFEMLYIWTTIPNCNVACLQQILQFCEENINGAWRGLSLLISGVVSKELHLHTKAIELYMKTMDWYDNQVNCAETLWPAFAAFEIASIYSMDPSMINESRKYFQLIKTKYKQFDFDQRLSVKVAAAVERLQLSQLTSPTVEDKSNCSIT